MEHWEAIAQVRAAVADIERLRTDTLQLLHESSVLLDQINRIDRPLMGLPRAKEQRSAPQFFSLPLAARSLLKDKVSRRAERYRV